LFFFFQAEDGIRDKLVTGVQTCALPISLPLPSQAHIQLGPHYDIEGHIARSSSSGSSATFNARVVLWRVEEVLPEVLYPISSGFPEHVVALVNQLVERMERIISLHQSRNPGVPLFLSTLPIPVHLTN